jgi:hypothetical protein
MISNLFNLPFHSSDGTTQNLVENGGSHVIFGICWFSLLSLSDEFEVESMLRQIGTKLLVSVFTSHQGYQNRANPAPEGFCYFHSSQLKNAFFFIWKAPTPKA